MTAPATSGNGWWMPARRPGPGPASTAMTSLRSGTGCGRTDASRLSGAGPRHMRILVVNAGSSSLKLRVVDEAQDLSFSEDLPRPRPEQRRGCTGWVRRAARPRRCRRRRRPSGRPRRYRVPRSDPRRRSRHRAARGPRGPGAAASASSIAALRWARAILPDVPHVACFDTAFHATIPEGRYIRLASSMARALAAAAIRLPRAVARLRGAVARLSCSAVGCR